MASQSQQQKIIFIDLLMSVRVPKVPFHFHDKLKNEIQNTILIFVFNTKMEMEIQ